MGPTPHFVFAHYMVCIPPTNGPTVGGYLQEIQSAQAAGLDGFALNEGDWSGPDWYYKTRTELLFQAAEAMGSGFKLFFSVELTNASDIVAMISAYAGRTNYFKHHGEAVVSTYGQGQVDWSQRVFAPLHQQGLSVFFVPYFQPPPNPRGGYLTAAQTVAAYSPIADGFFYFAAGNTVSGVTNANHDWQRACQAAGKLFMAGYSPNYWGCLQPNRGYIECHGGAGTVAQWMDIIQLQPDWVEMATWNDANESTYVTPAENPGYYGKGPRSPWRYSHAGFLELSKRYIAWYKTGQPPTIDRDALFFFYRAHSTNLVALNPHERPLTVLKGGVADVIYTTTFLTAPAQLEISSGTQLTTNQLVQGINHLETPFAAGPQSFTVRRNGVPILSAQGPDILSQIQVYDYFPFAGFAYGPAAEAARSVNLRTGPD